MSKYQPRDKRNIVISVQSQFINEYRRREIARLESITKCNPEGPLDKYY